MTYREAIEFLEGLRIFGTRPGLETTFELAAAVGNPQQQLRFIHVAGTNGKGSTCAMLESIYRGAGLKVGLYTSPHLVSFCERIQVNRRNIPEIEVARLVQLLKTVSEKSGTHPPTLFEITTVLALIYFAAERCDLVIWETGLGGRLDATNIVTPLVSVITNIQFDHMQWLGDSLEKIAAEKAGIIKPGIPVITATTMPEALAVIRQAAQAKSAPLLELSRPTETCFEPAALSLKGPHQRVNAALALATVERLQSQITISAEQALRALSDVQWPGRFQVIHRSPGQTIILDGAHNPDGFQVLAKTLRREYPNLKFTVIIGMLRDKSWPESVNLLLPLAHRLLAVPVQSERSLPPEDLAALCESSASKCAQEIIPCPSLGQALALAVSDSFTVVTGSLYLMGEAMQLLGLSAMSDERKLNEWSQAGAPRTGVAQ